MQTEIETIQEFLTRGELRLNRFDVIFQIVSIDENGRVEAIRENGRHAQINLTDKEIATLAGCCFQTE